MRKIHLLLTLVALSLATSSLWADVPEGALPGAFTVNNQGKKVYISKGNLQYIGSAETPYWKFADDQWVVLGNNGQGGSATNVDRDLFGWGTKNTPWNRSTTDANYTWQGDWGENAISNGGDTPNSGWRTFTASEWAYIALSRSNYSGLIAYNVYVHGRQGHLFLPDGWTVAKSALSSKPSGTISDENWDILENEGAVFLPRAGFWNYSVQYVGSEFDYWSSTSAENNQAYQVAGNTFSSSSKCGRHFGFAVRLVQDCPKPEITIQIPTTLYYTGSYQPLVTSASAVGGTMQYKLNSGSWTTTIPTASAKGTYSVYYKAVGDATHSDSEVYGPIQVQIINPLATLGTHPTAISPLKYNGSNQALVNAGSGVANGTLQYSLNGSSWSTSIPTGLLPGDYNVYYRVLANSGYSNFIPNPAYIVVNIAKGEYTPSGTYSVDANNLTYDGTAQPLVSLNGSVTDGTVWYKLEPSGEWTTEIPTGNNAGNYSVSYKVVPTDPNYDEYIPTDSPIAVTIAKANPSATLPESTISIPYDGAEHTLLEIDPVADCVIWYKLGDGDWTITPPTGTDAGDYSVQYKIVPNDAANYNTIGPNTVTVTILDYPTVYDNADPTTKLTELLNTPSDLKVKRTIYADDEYNTICLPFALDESALAASPLAGFNRLKTFKGAQVTGTAPDLYIDIFVEDATTIEAGIPYLITYPAAHADIVNPVFHGITVTTTEPSAVSVDGITFQGMFAQVHIDPYDAGHTQDYLFVGANSQLYWPLSTQTSSDIKMRGFRAYFIIDRNSISPALAPKGTRARIMDAPKTTTAIDNPSAKFGGSEKIIENGILYIIRNGVKYNAQGQVIK